MLVSDAFIREVDEDLRQKQINSLWKKYGKFIIGIAVGIVLLVSGRALYSSFIENKYIEQANAFSNAVKLNGSEITAALGPVIASDVDGYEIVATFKKAELETAAKNIQAAVATLDQFIKSGTVDTVYKDIANIQAAILELDTVPSDVVRARLSLILNGTSKFKYIANEILALSELRNDEVEAAILRLEALVVDVETPAGVKNRADQYLSVIK